MWPFEMLSYIRVSRGVSQLNSLDQHSWFREIKWAPCQKNKNLLDNILFIVCTLCLFLAFDRADWDIKVAFTETNFQNISCIKVDFENLWRNKQNDVGGRETCKWGETLKQKWKVEDRLLTVFPVSCFVYIFNSSFSHQIFCTRSQIKYQLTNCKYICGSNNEWKAVRTRKRKNSR